MSAVSSANLMGITGIARRLVLDGALDELKFHTNLTVEAILVEMSADKAMDLGVNWLVADTDSNGKSLPAGGFVQPVDGTGIGQIIQGVLNPEAIAGLPSGLTMGLGQIVNGGTSWAALIRAIGGVGNTNIIATPSIVIQKPPNEAGMIFTCGLGSGGVLWALWQSLGIVLNRLAGPVLGRIFPQTALRIMAPFAILGWLALARPVIIRLPELFG